MTTLAAALCLLAFACLALSQARHHAQALGAPAPPRRRALLRAAGWTLLALATWACVAAAGPSVGLVLALGLLNAAGLVVALALTYRPAWLPLLAGAALAAAAAAGVAAAVG